ncbi:hypothetical protein HYV80_06250 [Candidatus Woesearchaeota archaeon]|nr:hypothetical protein [Candidatus Woesearchaeota archaeon]
MADEEDLLGMEAPGSYPEWKIKNRLIRLKNRFARTKKGRWLGYMQEPEIGERGGPSETEIRKELGPEFEANENLIARLKDIEQRCWQSFKESIWESQNSIVARYRSMSFLTDPDIIQLEKRFFEIGTGFSENEEPIRHGIEENDAITVKKYTLGSEKVFYLDDDGAFPEEISVIGHATVPSIRKSWQNRKDDWDQEARDLRGDLGAIWNLINELDEKINGANGALAQIREREASFQNKWISPADESSRDFDSLWTSLEKLRPQNVRFKHTYRIVAPVIKNPKFDPNNTDEFFRKATWTFEEYCRHENESFKRNDEVEAGLDENGYPLEVGEDGTVLLDQWWSEIAQNEWQEKIIKSKPWGKEIWNAKVNNGVSKGGIRKVPKFFCKKLDLLKAALYMFHELDAVRDDLRAGVYHPHSKTAMDYILAGEGLSTIFYEGDRSFAPGELKQICGPLPYRTKTENGRDIETVIPKEKITLKFDQMSSYVTAKPSDFMAVPHDEKKVTRRYQMKLNLNEDDYTIESGIRKPSQLNPAHDRRASNAKCIDFHWGRMYYYEGKDGINKWSENPFPKKSSRGLPKYIADRLLRELYWDHAVRVGKNPVGWDIGLRKPLIGGNFPTDLLGASDLISARSHFESRKEESVGR